MPEEQSDPQDVNLSELTVKEIRAEREMLEVELRTLLTRFTENTGCIITYIDIDFDDELTPPLYKEVKVDVRLM